MAWPVQDVAKVSEGIGVLPEDLYTLYRWGELEQSRDLIRRVGYYELRQERQRACESFRLGKEVVR